MSLVDILRKPTGSLGLAMAMAMAILWWQKEELTKRKRVSKSMKRTFDKLQEEEEMAKEAKNATKPIRTSFFLLLMLCKVALRLQPINEGKYGASWSHGYCCPAIIRGCSVNSEQCSHIKLTKFGLFWRQSGPSSITCYSSVL